MAAASRTELLAMPPAATRPGAAAVSAPWPGLLLMVSLALVTRLPFFGHPAADYDEQLYSLIGQHLLAGHLPYLDLWDRKPLGLFAIYAAAHGLLGPQPFAYQAFALVACIAGGWLTYRLAARIAPPATAALATALYPPLMAIYGSHSGQSEIFLTALVLAMAEAVAAARAAVTLRPALARHALAMALGGLALQIKYSALPPCLWFGLLALSDLRRRATPPTTLAAAAAAFALLGLLPTLAALALDAANHGLDAFLFANFTSIRHRDALPLALTLGRQLADVAPLAALAAAGWLSRRTLPSPARATWLMALGWLGAGIASLFLSSTIYTYYYAALVPAVILVALPLFDAARRTGPWLLAGTLVWLVATFNPPAKATTARAEQETLAEMASAIAISGGARAPCLYVYDGPLALYALSGSGLPTRYIYPDHLDNALEAHALPVDPTAEVARIMAGNPDAVITAPQSVGLRNRASERVLAAALAENYRIAATWQFQQRRIELHLHRATYANHTGACANSVSKSSKLPPY